MKSLYQQHVERWRGGCGSEMCARGTKCLARGTVPCDVLFIGEAPGESEEVLGRPFCGPAGHLLDRIIKKGLPSRLTFAVTNLVGCIPRDFTEGGKASEPDDDQVACCAPRLQEFVWLADPQLIVCVGACSRDWLDTKQLYHVEMPRRCARCGLLPVPPKETPSGKRRKRWEDSRTKECPKGCGPLSDIPKVDIKHPAAILRNNVALRGLDEQRAVVILAGATDNLQPRGG